MKVVFTVLEKTQEFRGNNNVMHINFEKFCSFNILKFCFNKITIQRYKLILTTKPGNLTMNLTMNVSP